MAEIAYVPLTQEDNAFWLTRAALADYGEHVPPGLMSGLLVLEAHKAVRRQRRPT